MTYRSTITNLDLWEAYEQSPESVSAALSAETQKFAQPIKNVDIITMKQVIGRCFSAPASEGSRTEVWYYFPRDPQEKGEHNMDTTYDEVLKQDGRTSILATSDIVSACKLSLFTSMSTLRRVLTALHNSYTNLLKSVEEGDIITAPRVTFTWQASEVHISLNMYIMRRIRVANMKKMLSKELVNRIVAGEAIDLNALDEDTRNSIMQAMQTGQLVEMGKEINITEEK